MGGIRVTGCVGNTAFGRRAGCGGVGEGVKIIGRVVVDYLGW
jgi:hypothetical protein